VAGHVLRQGLHNLAHDLRIQPIQAQTGSQERVAQRLDILAVQRGGEQDAGADHVTVRGAGRHEVLDGVGEVMLAAFLRA